MGSSDDKAVDKVLEILIPEERVDETRALLSPTPPAPCFTPEAGFAHDA
jgi:hypothetical protein